MSDAHSTEARGISLLHLATLPVRFCWGFCLLMVGLSLFAVAAASGRSTF